MHKLARPLSPKWEGLLEHAYFESLLETALSRGLIGRDFVEGVQMGCMELLALQCRRYTGGQSTSLPREQAEEILQSTVFTLGIWLKEFPGPQEALNALATGTAALAIGLQAGLSKIQIKAKATRQFYRLALKRMLDTDNALYNDTAYGGIPGFFKLYEPRFGAHAIHITADYPVLFYPQGFQGIEFIQRYLQALDYENRICRAFPAQALKAAFTRHALEYDTTVENLHANLCAVVLEAALACALAGDPIPGLSLSPAGQTRLAPALEAADPQALLLQAWDMALAGVALGPAPAAYARAAIVARAPEMAGEMRLLL